METNHQRRQSIWIYLASSSGATLRELAQRFSVSKNTIKRDIDHLSSGGARMLEEANGQTFSFRAEAKPPAANLTADEKAALHAAQLSFAPWAGTPLAVDLTSALLKVGVNTEMPLEVRGPVALARTDPRVLARILSALREHRRCEIHYRPRGEDSAHPLLVEPLRVIAVSGLLYLRARSCSRGTVITLALHLAESAELRDERFVPVRDRSSGFGATDGKVERVVARFHAEIAPFIEERQWHPSQRLTNESDGSLRFEARVSGMHEFVGWMMSWGPRAELLQPKLWRQEIEQRASAMAAAHQAPEMER